MTVMTRPAESIPATVRRLAAHQKSKAGAPAYSRFVNRPLGRWFAATAYHLGMTPDQVTLVSAVTTFAGVCVLALGPSAVATGLLAGLLLVLGYALDSGDGQLARLGGGGSLAGEWLEHVCDGFKSTAVHVGALIGLFRAEVPSGWLLVPLAYAIVDSLGFFVFVATDLMRRLQGPDAAKPASSSSVLRSLLTIPTDYGFLAVTFLLFGLPQVFIVVYAVMLLGNIGYLVLGLPRWYAGLRTLRRA